MADPTVAAATVTGLKPSTSYRVYFRFMLYGGDWGTSNWGYLAFETLSSDNTTTTDNTTTKKSTPRTVVATTNSDEANTGAPTTEEEAAHHPSTPNPTISQPTTTQDGWNWLIWIYGSGGLAFLLFILALLRRHAKREKIGNQV